jgi:hypothetical protein
MHVYPIEPMFSPAHWTRTAVRVPLAVGFSMLLPAWN